MMNNPSFLRAQTILAAFAQAGAKVAVITAKDKLRLLLGAGLNGLCLSAENEGQPVYSSELSEHVVRRGVELMRSAAPDIMYLATSDYIQHSFAPGSTEANRFYGVIDDQLSKLDGTGATIIVTADHGMNAKADAEGRPHILFLQESLDAWFGAGSTCVILPITDPYVAHHGSLGSFACIYLQDRSNARAVLRRLAALPNIDLVLENNSACQQFELPEDRIGDLVVCSDSETVLGTRQNEHDLSSLQHPLRSHGGLAEREVPLLFNRPIVLLQSLVRLRNYDAFWIGLNCAGDSRIADSTSLVTKEKPWNFRI